MGPSVSGSLSKVMRAGLLLLLIGPVLTGLIWVVLPAFGYLPAAGGTAISLAPFVDALSYPGMSAAVALSIRTGVLATVISLALTFLILASTRGRLWGKGFLAPLLSIPHAAAAIGFAFLIAPSGWFARAASPLLTGWERPPDVLILNDPFGWSLTFGLVAKEVPFLLLVSLAALTRIDDRSYLRMGQSLGYPRVVAWGLLVAPLLYRSIRLPLILVLAFSMTVVDVALILGPSRPPTLSVLILDWMNDPDISLRFRASAAAVIQFVALCIVLALWWGGERVVAWAMDRTIGSGRRLTGVAVLRWIGRTALVLTVSVVSLSILVLAIWSLAKSWRFPDALPNALTRLHWSRHASTLMDTVGLTLLIAGLSALISLVIALIYLSRDRDLPDAVIYLPLLMPQSVFLPGLQTAMLSAGIYEGFGVVLFTHLIFVLPYVILMLRGPYRAFDTRFLSVAASLGHSPMERWLRIKLPMLLAPILTATAVGFAVSVGQYLPTLFMGGGRFATLTTEAVALMSGGDRRAIAVFALGQALAALLPFALALVIPAIFWRNRRGMSVGG